MALPNVRNGAEKKPAVNQYYHTVARRFAIAKYITLLVFVVFILASLTAGRNEITLENLQYLMKFISFTNAETSITAPKINYSSSDNTRLELFIGDLCYLSGNGFTIYDSRGNTILTDRIKLNFPILHTGEKYVLCYDLGGTSYAVYNTFSRLVSDSTEYPITDAAISDEGAFAVASSTREYRTAVTLYDSDFKQSSRILRENYLTDVQMKPDGTEVALMTVASVNGNFSTTLELITLGHDSVRKSVSFDAIAYSMYYTDNGLIVVSDVGLRFYDRDLMLLSQTGFDSSPVMTDCSDKYLTLVCSTGIVGNRYEVLVYDTSGKLVCREPFDGKLASISHDDSGEYIFILAGDSVIRLNLVNRKIGSLTVSSGGIKVIAQDADSFLLAMNNYALTYADRSFDEYYFDREKPTDS